MDVIDSLFSWIFEVFLDWSTCSCKCLLTRFIKYILKGLNYCSYISVKIASDPLPPFPGYSCTIIITFELLIMSDNPLIGQRQWSIGAQSTDPLIALLYQPINQWRRSRLTYINAHTYIYSHLQMYKSTNAPLSHTHILQTHRHMRHHAVSKCYILGLYAL